HHGQAGRARLSGGVRGQQARDVRQAGVAVGGQRGARAVGRGRGGRRDHDGGQVLAVGEVRRQHAGSPLDHPAGPARHLVRGQRRLVGPGAGRGAGGGRGRHRRADAERDRLTGGHALRGLGGGGLSRGGGTGGDAIDGPGQLPQVQVLAVGGQRGA